MAFSRTKLGNTKHSVVVISAFEESMARARQRLVVRGPILQGIPVAPAPEEEESVDTTLRLSLATPDANDR